MLDRFNPSDGGQPRRGPAGFSPTTPKDTTTENSPGPPLHRTARTHSATDHAALGNHKGKTQKATCGHLVQTRCGSRCRPPDTLGIHDELAKSKTFFQKTLSAHARVEVSPIDPSNSDFRKNLLRRRPLASKVSPARTTRNIARDNQCAKS